MRPALALILALLAPIACADPARFAFGIIGDAPYSALEESVLAGMVREMNAEDLAFVVHVGDIKNGSSPCSDELYSERKAMFQASRHAFILVPGDNEWTDCHRKAAGGYDPLERLDRLRTIFFAGETSLGQNPIALARQSGDATMPEAYRIYRENVRWVANNVLFFGLNVPGSNNNFGRTPQMDAEYEARSRANAAWLERGFALAREQNYAAVFIFIQANPDFDGALARHGMRVGAYAGFKQQLLAHTLAFGKPVVLVHGDTHRFRYDQPMIDPATGMRVDNFTRIESFGSPLLDWIRIDMDPLGAASFKIKTGSALKR